MVFGNNLTSHWSGTLIAFALLSVEALETATAPMRILITGASGSGTTTLGRHLSSRLNMAFFDTDDYFWVRTEPPYQEKRDPNLRLSLLRADLEKVPDSVISGSVMDWGAELADSFSLIVFLVVDTEVRIARLREREIERFGHADPEFLEWAAQYEEGRMEGRSRKLHEKWLTGRSCPILRIEGDLPVAESVEQVAKALSNFRSSGRAEARRSP